MKKMMKNRWHLLVWVIVLELLMTAFPAGAIVNAASQKDVNSVIVRIGNKDVDKKYIRWKGERVKH